MKKKLLFLMALLLTTVGMKAQISSVEDLAGEWVESTSGWYYGTDWAEFSIINNPVTATVEGDKVTFNGLLGDTQSSLVATVDMAAKTLTFAAGQTINYDGYPWEFGGEAEDNSMIDLVGKINDDGTLSLDGLNIFYSGYSYMWNTTVTLSRTKSDDEPSTPAVTVTATALSEFPSDSYFDGWDSEDILISGYSATVIPLDGNKCTVENWDGQGSTMTFSYGSDGYIESFEGIEPDPDDDYYYLPTKGEYVQVRPKLDWCEVSGIGKADGYIYFKCKFYDADDETTNGDFILAWGSYAPAVEPQSKVTLTDLALNTDGSEFDEDGWYSVNVTYNGAINDETPDYYLSSSLTYTLTKGGETVAENKEAPFDITAGKAGIWIENLEPDTEYTLIVTGVTVTDYSNADWETNFGDVVFSQTENLPSLTFTTPALPATFVVTPAAGEVESISEITIAMSDGSMLVASAQDGKTISLLGANRTTVAVWDAETLSGIEPTFNDEYMPIGLTLTLPEAVTAAGNYMLVIDEGVFYVGDYMNANEAATFEWTIAEKPITPSDEKYDINIADGSEVESLSEFILTFADDVVVGTNGTAQPYVKNAMGKVVAKGTPSYDWDVYNIGIITLANEITEPGTYTLFIPAGTFSLDWDGNVLTQEVTYTYTIAGDPLPGAISDLQTLLDEALAYDFDAIPELEASALNVAASAALVVLTNKAATYDEVCAAYADLQKAIEAAQSVKGAHSNTTGINGIANNANAAIYNVAGQKFSKLQKGINIINGRKVFK